MPTTTIIYCEAMLFINLIYLFIQSQGFIGWETLESVRFEVQYVEEFGFEAEMPKFDDEILAKAGKEMVIQGHHLPLDYGRKTIVLSKLPFASCFFCGGGVGQETIAEIHFKTKQRIFKPDEILKIKGKLKLNDTDFDHFVFILEEAEVIE